MRLTLRRKTSALRKRRLKYLPRSSRNQMKLQLLRRAKRKKLRTTLWI